MVNTKIFFDVEHTGFHKLSTPISVGLVAEDGKEYYAEFTDFDDYQITDALRDNILSRRMLGDYDFAAHYDPDGDKVYVKGDTELIRETLVAWLLQYKSLEMWGDCMAYDWVMFISIFGSETDLPNNISKTPMDISTALRLCNEDVGVNRAIYAYGEELAKSNDRNIHNALYDAQTELAVYKKLLGKMEVAGNESLKEEDEVETDEVETEEVETEEVETEEVETEEVETEEVETEAEIVGEEGVVDKEEIKAQENIKELVGLHNKRRVKIDSKEKNPTPKKRGRPPKKKVTPKPNSDIAITQLPEISSNVNVPPTNGFTEPTQDEVEGTEEWNPPL